ncbi:hypothetical protein [Stenoxybacter acetivorans]|uniref:hypothetical protein n=1 Tax=Stenoxybacter acetivorans TaxID=422441 RepID=UPI00056B16F9|nr:hypothetical protein [Stenoxybacter acetivorans]
MYVYLNTNELMHSDIAVFAVLHGKTDLPPNVFAVGFFLPDGRFYISDFCGSVRDAEELVSFLNGGNLDKTAALNKNNSTETTAIADCRSKILRLLNIGRGSDQNCHNREAIQATNETRLPERAETIRKNILHMLSC